MNPFNLLVVFGLGYEGMTVVDSKLTQWGAWFNIARHVDSFTLDYEYINGQFEVMGSIKRLRPATLMIINPSHSDWCQVRPFPKKRLRFLVVSGRRLQAWRNYFELIFPFEKRLGCSGGLLSGCGFSQRKHLTRNWEKYLHIFFSLPATALPKVNKGPRRFS